MQSTILTFLLGTMAAAVLVPGHALGQSTPVTNSPQSYVTDPASGTLENYPTEKSKQRDGYTDSQDATVSYSSAIEYFSSRARAEYSPQGSYRQPVCIEFMTESQALISTKLSGELFAYDAEQKTVESVFSDPRRRWGQLLSFSDREFAAIDQANSSVVLWERAGDGWTTTAELDCPGTPRALAWEPRQQDSQGGILYVSGQWSQRLYRFQKLPAVDAADGLWKALSAIDLPMCGGVILPLPKHDCILVMDAFGRDYAVVDASSASVRKHDQLYGHNISQIVAVDDQQRVLYTHQLLNEFVRSMRGEITWGGMLSNNLRWLQTERLLHETGPAIFSEGKFYPIGVTGDGAGDPSSFCLSTDGRIAITLGGTDRVAIADLVELDFAQIDVGYHPVDCSFSPDGRQLLVVNQFSDNLSIIDTESHQVEHLPLGALREPTAVERGERLFFHSKISHDNWMSCHSCHSQGHTNGQLNDNLTDETFGTPKRILSLLGAAETSPYGWSGRFDDLKQQVEHSIRSTMATDHGFSQQMIEDLAAYVGSLPSPPSLAEARGEAAMDERKQGGRQLFAELGCADCHSPPHYTSRQVVDVGLVDEAAMKLFNPPSLIGVGQRQNALFHDGRAKSLEAVFSEYQHQLPHELSESQRDCLIEFLLQL